MSLWKDHEHFSRNGHVAIENTRFPESKTHQNLRIRNAEVGSSSLLPSTTFP